MDHLEQPTMASAAPATCCVCLDDHPHNLLTRVGDNIVCHDCSRQMLQRAMDNEADYPPKLGSHTLDVLAYHNLGIVSNEFLLDYNQKEREYRCPVNRRIFCTWPKLSALPHAGQSTIEHCNYFLGQSIEKPTDVQVNGGKLVIACAECHRLSCLSCGKRIEGYEQSRDHRCISLSAAYAESAAFEGMQRGKHYQICPSERCGRRVELRDGCNHMSCMCGMQFCFLCGEVVSAQSNHWEQRTDGSGCPRYNQPGAPNAAFDPNMAQRAAHRAATQQAAQQVLRDRLVNVRFNGRQTLFDPGEELVLPGHRVDRGPVYPTPPGFGGRMAGQVDLPTAARVTRGAHQQAPPVLQGRRFHGGEMMANGLDDDIVDMQNHLQRAQQAPPVLQGHRFTGGVMMANRLDEDIADMQDRLQRVRRASEEREALLASMLRAEANTTFDRFDDSQGPSIATGPFAQGHSQQDVLDHFPHRRNAISGHVNDFQDPSIAAGTFAQARARAQGGFPNDFFQGRHAIPEHVDGSQGPPVGTGTFAQAQAERDVLDNFPHWRHANSERVDDSQRSSTAASRFTQTQAQGDAHILDRGHARVFTGPGSGRPVGFYGNNVYGEDHPHPLQSNPNPAHGLASPFTYVPVGQQTDVSHGLPGYARPLRSAAENSARNYSPWNQTDFRPGAPSPVLRPLGAAYASGLPNMRSSENEATDAYNTTARPDPDHGPQLPSTQMRTLQSGSRGPGDRFLELQAESNFMSRDEAINRLRHIRAQQNHPPAPTSAHATARTTLQGRLARMRRAAAARSMMYDRGTPSPPSQEERDLA